MTISKDTELSPLTIQERQRMFDLIFTRTHTDYKGHIGPDKVRTVLSYAKFGGGLSTEACMSDAELRERYAVLVKRDPRRF